MAWLTTEEFADLVTGSNTSDLPPDTIPNCLQSALNHIRRLVGDPIMSEVESDSAGSVVSKTADLREAQELLARRKLLLIVAGKMREGGLVLTERDADGNATNGYATPQQTEAKRAALLADALELIAPYYTSETEIIVEQAHPRSGSVPISIDW